MSQKMKLEILKTSRRIAKRTAVERKAASMRNTYLGGLEAKNVRRDHHFSPPPLERTMLGRINTTFMVKYADS
jgi:hypothetical protein